MPLRIANKPSSKSRPSSPDRIQDDDDMQVRNPNRQHSIQSLSHQQLVTRQRQMLLRQLSDSSADGRDTSTVDESLRSATTSNVNTIVNDIEARSRIDVEKAIGLLQELKKTASPDELVALHRALLPAKTDNAAPAPRLALGHDRVMSPIPPERSRSEIPPGLATRDQDILRKPFEHDMKQRRDIFDRSSRIHKRHESEGQISNRSVQPYSHAGAFAPGSLRITNASPEPSIVSPQDDDEERLQGVAFDNRNVPQALGRPAAELDKEPGKAEHTVERAFRNQHESGRAALSSSREGPSNVSSQKRADVRADLRLDPPLEQLSRQQIPEPDSQDVPRFQQRWGHRAMHLSNEYLFDCEISESPYEEKSGFTDRNGRLSTVQDEGESDTSDTGIVTRSRRDTLHKLTGSRDYDQSQERDHTIKPKAVDEIGITGSQLSKADSGYCSEASTSPTRKASIEAVKQRNAGILQTPRPTARNHKDQLATATPETGLSFINDNEATSNKSSPAQSSKRSPLSMFKSVSRATKKGSLNVLSGSCSETTSITGDLEDETPARPTRPVSRGSDTRKLQKSMPESIKRKRKKTLENMKRSTSENTPTVQDSSTEHETRQENEDSSECFVGCHPLEPVETTTTPQSNAASMRKVSRSFSNPLASRGKRGKTLGESNKDLTALPQTPASPFRERSKTNAEKTTPTPVHGTTDMVASSCLMAEIDPVDQSVPARDRVHSDFGSVAMALPSTEPDPADPPVSPTKRGSLPRYYSVNKYDIEAAESNTAISPKPSQSKQPKKLIAKRSSVQNANAEEQRTPAPAAAPLPKPSGPRPAMPKTPSSASSNIILGGAQDGKAADQYAPFPQPLSHHEHGKGPSNSSEIPVALGSKRSVEDRFPGWQGKPASPNTIPPQMLPLSQQEATSPSPYSHARLETGLTAVIPPLPELPSDLAAMVSRADQMVAKKMRHSPRNPVANGSARHTIDFMDNTRELLVEPAAARKDSKEAYSREDDTPYDRPNVAKDEYDQGSTKSVADRWSVNGVVALPKPPERGYCTSPSHDSQHPGWPGWEKQSTLWRQRREAQAARLGQKDETATNEISRSESPTMPGVVVSRYISPISAQNAHNAGRVFHSDVRCASKYAQEYANLIEDDKENAVAMPNRADSVVSSDYSVGVVSTATYLTMHNVQVQSAVPNNSSRPASALSMYSAVSASSYGPSVRSTLGGGRPRPQSYRSLPAPPIHEERARALASAASQRSTDSLALPDERPELRKRHSDSLCDRYGGGMQYGWDRESGFHGSAGTRSTTGSEVNDNRKSVKMSEEFGLDLSDIPVYLRKGNSFNRM